MRFIEHEVSLRHRQGAHKSHDGSPVGCPAQRLLRDRWGYLQWGAAGATFHASAAWAGPCTGAVEPALLDGLIEAYRSLTFVMMSLANASSQMS